MMAFEPRQQGRAKVEADVRIVDDIWSVTLGVNALVPIMARRGARFRLNLTRPGVLTRRLIKMAMNYKSSHVVKQNAKRAAPSKPALSPHSALAIFTC